MSRLVLVTGASRGIGRSIAEHFIATGDRVVALSRSGEGPSGSLESLTIDVADGDAVARALQGVAERHGAFDVTVINAGVTRDGLALRMDDATWREVLDVNLDGAFHCVRSVLPAMLKQRSGAIIFIGSVAPFIGLPGQANYAASKAGLVGLARSLASEIGRRNVTVNVVAPGFIETDMTAALSEQADAVRSRTALGRLGTADDVTGAVAFLASPAASFITGVVLPVDGGLSMGI